MGRRRRSLVAAAAVLALTTACATDDAESIDVTLGVAAAPSLAGAFTELIDVFESEHEYVKVHLELGRSGQIAENLGERTDLHVFSSASDEAMDAAVDDGTAVEPRVFARNHVVLAVPSGNPGGVSTLADLSRDELRVGLCAPDVPCGRAADSLLGAAGVAPVVDDRDSGSRSLASSLGGNEFDVGIIYRTDVAASHGWVSQVGVDAAERNLTQEAGAVTYSIARVPSGEDDGPVGEAERTAGDEFRELVLSDRGRRALESAGLQPFTG